VVKMLQKGRVHPTLPATDFGRAKSFYSEKLGLTVTEESPAGAFYECGEGTRFLVFPSGGASSGTHTQLGFVVEDVSAEVAELQGRGVVFEEYDGPNLKTENGVATVGPGKAAWFKDSEGNMLGIIQFA
jgi:catechol 2,3-dioxygenase-like lactoylglutathione lyase family enzyme